MIFVILLCLCLQGHSQNATSTIAIQNTDEVYISYVPLTPCLNATDSQLQPGSVNYTLLNPTIIFNALSLSVQLSFWQLIKNGISILLNSNSFLMNGTYSQIVYYNSSISDAFSDRQFILTSFTETGNIVLTYANAQYNTLNNITLNLDGNITIDFDQNVSSIVVGCLEMGSTLKVVYIGQGSYLALCPNTTDIFSFNPLLPNQTYIYDFDIDPVQDIAPNPLLLIPNQTINSTLWNVALLATGGITALFCNFNQSNFTCNGFLQDVSWLQTIAIRMWGLQETIQQQQAMMILTIFPQISQLSFQGSILSVFRMQDTVYIESIADGQIFLAIFDGNTLLVNTSLLGNVLYYGSQKLVVEAQNGSLFIVSFTLPYTTITNNGSQQPNKTINLQCEGYEYNQTFQIFWTNIGYPTSIVVPLKQNNKTSQHALYTLDLNDEFEVIGPAFDVFATNNDPLQIALMSAPILMVTSRISAIFQIEFIRKVLPQFPFVIYILNTFGQLTSVNSRGLVKPIASNPCGFTQVSYGKKIGSQYLIQNTDNQLCLCQAGLKGCEEVTPSKLSTLLQSANLTAAQRSELLSLSHQTFQIYPSSGGELIQQLYSMANQGIIINVYADGQIDMTDIQGSILASLQSNCSYNLTEGLIFVRNFYDNFFFVLCQGDATITQYLIRDNDFIFNRIIPLWGFVIRPGGNWLSGANYLFLEADINPEYFGPFVDQDYSECCVLRLDPNEFTASIIAQVVQANRVLLVQSLEGVDIAYYNETTLIQTAGYLKVYFQNSWISFKQTQKCRTSPCAPQTYQYNLSFASLLYNFASSFGQTITFDTTNASINANLSPLTSITFQQSNFSQYNATIQFNFTNVCGPMMDYSLTYLNQSNSTIYEMSVNRVVTRNKMLSQFASMILQVMDLGALVPDSAFSNFIMVIQATAINIFSKFDGIWLDQKAIITIPVPNCLFYLYSIQNDTFIQLASNCYNLDIPTILLKLQYQNQSNITVQFAPILLPAQLRSIKSIPQVDDKPFIFGLGEGPSDSITGLLIFCQEYCNQLQINTKLGFVIDFDVTTMNDQVFVVGLDLLSLSLWTNLTAPTNVSAVVKANFTLNYQSVLNQSCDNVKITYPLSLTQANLLLSCTTTYFEIAADFTTPSITILQIYQKFLNCNPVDKSNPAFTLVNGEIDVLAIVCNQNAMTLRTEEFQTIDSSNSSIVTAYLQIYVPQGPFCNSSSAPIRILPLAVTLTDNTYILYSSGGFLKLLYEQMNGMLVDSFIDKQPSANFSLIQLTKQQIFPQLSLAIFNSYYSISFEVESAAMKTQPSIVVAYIVQGFFLFTNVLTLASLICWFAFKRNKRSSRSYNSQYEIRDINSNSSDTSRVPLSNPSPQNQQNTSTISSPINSPLVRRVTQIQLFQPRYKPA